MRPFQPPITYKVYLYIYLLILNFKAGRSRSQTAGNCRKFYMPCQNYSPLKIKSSFFAYLDFLSGFWRYGGGKRFNSYPVHYVFLCPFWLLTSSTSITILELNGSLIVHIRTVKYWLTSALCSVICTLWFLIEILSHIDLTNRNPSTIVRYTKDE